MHDNKRSKMEPSLKRCDHRDSFERLIETPVLTTPRRRFTAADFKGDHPAYRDMLMPLLVDPPRLRKKKRVRSVKLQRFPK
jgi:hypothetical protein